MTGLTMTDCSVADNVTQAKWEFERAVGLPVGSPSRDVLLRDWADKWGASLLEVAAEHAGEDDDGVNENFTVVRKGELDEAIEECNEIRATVRDAIRNLESCL